MKTQEQCLRASRGATRFVAFVEKLRSPWGGGALNGALCIPTGIVVEPLRRLLAEPLVEPDLLTYVCGACAKLFCGALVKLLWRP